MIHHKLMRMDSLSIPVVSARSARYFHINADYCLLSSPSQCEASPSKLTNKSLEVSS